MARFAAIALFLLTAAEPTRPELRVRVSPPISIANPATGCAPVLLTAEIRGPEVERFYCPEVVWEWPDTTVSATASDCPPFEARHECVEPQTGCGIRGWHRGQDGKIVEDRKDCPCTIVGYPRRWTRHVCMPQHPTGGAWEIWVRLVRNRETIARDSVRVHVK